jgi:hypothetical protein
MEDKTLELLKRLLEATNKLDRAYLDLIYHGQNDMTGEKYDEINDVLVEVEEYLELYEF